MITTYGTYSHDDNETWHTISYKQNYSPVGRKSFRSIRWTIYGVKTAASVAALTTALTALENAYTFDGNDLTFYDNSSNPTVHSIVSGNTIGGTRVSGFEYMPGTASVGGSYGSGSEYTLRRTYKITIDAEVLTPEINVIDYRESIKTIGTGGPKNILMGSLVGAMQQQTVQLFTPFYAIQSGTATGLLDYPDPPAPFAPAFLDGPPTIQELGTPKFSRNLPTGYTISWMYKFQSSALLVGAPTNF